MNPLFTTRYCQDLCGRIGGMIRNNGMMMTITISISITTITTNRGIIQLSTFMMIISGIVIQSSTIDIRRHGLTPFLGGTET